MAYILKRNGKTPNIPFKHFECDTVSDLSKIDLYLVQMGSTCRVLSTGDFYVLNSANKWVKQPRGSSSSGGDGSGGGNTGGGQDGNWDGGDLDELA